MAEIVIPFHEDFKPRMLNGRKTATTRPKRYGYPGDWFRVFGEVFVLREVFPTFIDAVADYFYFEEGFDHSHEFIDFWDRIHRRIKFRDNPGRRVYHHRFIRNKVAG